MFLPNWKKFQKCHVHRILDGWHQSGVIQNDTKWFPCSVITCISVLEQCKKSCSDISLLLPGGSQSLDHVSESHCTGELTFTWQRRWPLSAAQSSGSLWGEPLLSLHRLKCGTAEKTHRKKQKSCNEHLQNITWESQFHILLQFSTLHFSSEPKSKLNWKCEALKAECVPFWHSPFVPLCLLLLLCSLMPVNICWPEWVPGSRLLLQAWWGSCAWVGSWSHRSLYSSDPASWCWLSPTSPGSEEAGCRHHTKGPSPVHVQDHCLCPRATPRAGTETHGQGLFGIRENMMAVGIWRTACGAFVWWAQGKGRKINSFRKFNFLIISTMYELEWIIYLICVRVIHSIYTRNTHLN